MKRSLSLKQWSLFAALLTLATLLTLYLYGKTHQDARFYAFAQNFFLEEVQANPIHLHYTIDDPAAYGIDESALSLPVYQAGSAASEIYAISRAREELSRIDPNALQEKNRRLYELLDSYLTAAADVAAHPYFSEPLSPSSGVPSEIPILLAEYRMDDVADVENYLRILEQVPAYFDGLILYEQEKAAAGLFMSDTTADRMIAQCGALLDAETIEDGTHFLETTFTDRLKRLADQNLLSETEISAYEARHQRILTTSVIPAYGRLADALTLLKGQGEELGGLAERENGREYYLALLRLRTGSYRDIAEIKRLLAEDLKLNYETLVSILSRNPALQTMILQTPDFLPEMTPEEVLNDLREEIGTNYPAIPEENDSAPIHSTIKYVDESLAAYSAPAFYMTPPIDNICENLICLNPKDTGDDLSLYTTLAHEGYPGHLYQTVYSKRFQEQEGNLPLSSVLYYGGYVEGWAMYVELASYDRATALAVQEHPEAALYYQVCRLDRQFRLGLYSLLDVAIHYDGLSREEVGALCQGLGLSDGDALTALYTYIAEEPCNYLKYYLGYLEIIELKRQAAVLWSDTDRLSATYDNTDFLYRFHSFLLQNGPADYRTLARRLAVY
ncbi:MAG: DUF885 domain-containing protein [Bacteroidales bacterium]|nr:DUF885 domain-containing protein [Bacteroidales bacterium]MCM1414928.1 DUF885 domain-containing protein [bacterium]MCM1423076.1 DUF885 domain-containing protein [bacterium]